MYGTAHAAAAKTKKGSAWRFPLEWSGKRDSNSRPQPWQGCALPTELFPHRLWRREAESNRSRRICNPLHNRFAIAPSRTERKREARASLVRRVWSGKRDSNSRPQPWQGCALPTELFPRRSRKYSEDSGAFRHEAEKRAVNLRSALHENFNAEGAEDAQKTQNN